MATYSRLYPFLLLLFSTITFAATDPGLSEIEAAEREQIIKDLSYRLDTQEACDSTLKWSDQGSGAQMDGYFYLPNVKDDVFIIGGVGAQDNTGRHCVITASIPNDNPKNTPKLLVPPKDWKLIWTDKGSGAEKDGSIWAAIPPDKNYHCVGNVAQPKYIKPDIPNYRCVHESLTRTVNTRKVVWSDFGSNALKPVTIFQLPVSNSFVAVPDRVEKLETVDIKSKPIVQPGKKQVDALLAQRMEKIQQDLQKSAKQQVAEKQPAAAPPPPAEQLQDTSPVEQKPPVVAEKEKPAPPPVEKVETTEAAPMPQQPEPVATIEAPMPAEPATMPESTSAPVATTSGDEEEGSFTGFLIKVFGTAFIVVVIVGVIIFKLMFGSKKPE